MISRACMNPLPPRWVWKSLSLPDLCVWITLHERSRLVRKSKATIGCPCGITIADHSCQSYCGFHAVLNKKRSISDREAKVKDGVLWKSRTVDGLLKETEVGWTSRWHTCPPSLCCTTYQRLTKAGLFEQLTFDPHGIRRLPALLLGNPS